MEKEFEVENRRLENVNLKVREMLAPKGRHRVEIEQKGKKMALEFSNPQEIVDFGLALARAGQKHKKE